MSGHNSIDRNTQRIDNLLGLEVNDSNVVELSLSEKVQNRNNSKLSSSLEVEDTYTVLGKSSLSINGFGENTDPVSPLFNNLKKISAVLPAGSTLSTEKEILRDHIYNKQLGHDKAYKDILDLQFSDLTTEEQASADMDGFIAVNRKIQILDKDEVRDYIPIKLKTSTEGIIAHALICPATGEMKVLFRGTKNLASMAADLEIGGPGAESYAKDMNALMAQTNALVAQYGVTKITSTGHSLGGALAQQYEQSLIDARAQNLGFAASGRFHIPEENRNHLNQVKEIAGYFYNSAGAPKDAVLRNPEALKFLTAHKEQANLKVSGNHFHVGGDIVQVLGAGSIFAGVPKEDAFVSMVKLQNGWEGYGKVFAAAGGTVGTIAGAVVGSVLGPIGTAVGSAVAGAIVGGITGMVSGAVPAALATHCNKHFKNQESTQLGYIVATNETDAGRELIRQKISNKTPIVNNPVTEAIQKELVLAARQGGVSSAAGLVAGAVKGGAIGLSVAGPAGLVVGGTIGAVVGAVGAHRVSNAVVGVANAAASAVSTVGSAAGQAATYAASAAYSAASSLKNYFWGSSSAQGVEPKSSSIEITVAAAKNVHPVAQSAALVAVPEAPASSMIFAGPRTVVTDIASKPAAAPVAAPEATKAKKRFWYF